MVTQLLCPCHQRNESFLASWLWLLLWLPLQYQVAGSSTASRFQPQVQLASSSCSLLMLCLMEKRKIPHKNFKWTDLRLYIPMYPRLYATAYSFSLSF